MENFEKSVVEVLAIFYIESLFFLKLCSITSFTMLSTVCASYMINARSPQNAFISFEAQHKIERALPMSIVYAPLLPMLRHDLQSTHYPALLAECRSNIRTR